MGTQASKENRSIANIKTGGARRDRTADLLHAMQALSQLSYGPTWRRGTLPHGVHFVKEMKELGPARQRRLQSGKRLRLAQNGESGIDWRGHGPAAHRDADRRSQRTQREAMGLGDPA